MRPTGNDEQSAIGYMHIQKVFALPVGRGNSAIESVSMDVKML
jgi:hypothetical protein